MSIDLGIDRTYAMPTYIVDQTMNSTFNFFFCIFFYVAVAKGEESSAAHTMIRKTTKEKTRERNRPSTPSQNGLSGTLGKPVTPTPKSTE